MAASRQDQQIIKIFEQLRGSAAFANDASSFGPPDSALNGTFMKASKNVSERRSKIQAMQVILLCFL
jgi:hypothetical protein